MSWYGWGRRRKGGRWVRLTGPYPTMPECSRALGQEARRRGFKDANVMMTTGAVPRRLGQAPQYSENL